MDATASRRIGAALCRTLDLLAGIERTRGEWVPAQNKGQACALIASGVRETLALLSGADEYNELLQAWRRYAGTYADMVPGAEKGRDAAT